MTHASRTICNRFLLGAAALFASTAAVAQVNCCMLPNNTIIGTVNADVTAANCSCTIARTANINGNIDQTGDGALVIRGIVNGGIAESADGSVAAVVEGIFEGNIEERGAGDLATEGSGWSKGNTEHELPGACSNSIKRFEGAACNPL
jgi:hypothetical protein